ncbi:Drosulfakinin I [Sergentomyia squamirostris]
MGSFLLSAAASVVLIATYLILLDTVALAEPSPRLQILTQKSPHSRRVFVSGHFSTVRRLNPVQDNGWMFDADDEGLSEKVRKRIQTPGGYGHLRSGKRSNGIEDDQYDDYGHSRFGR